MLSPLFLKYATPLLEREGGEKFTNRAADKGGPTRWGVIAKTLGEWRKLGRAATADEVKALGKAEALEIYNAEFFVKTGIEAIAQISEAIAEELLDTAVNMGPYWPAKWLQEDLNLCNNRGRDWPDILVDADLGAATRSALRSLISRRGLKLAEELMLKCLNADQLARYKVITLSGGPNGSQEENFVGWIRTRIGMP